MELSELLDKGNDFLKNEQYDEAIEYFKKAIDIDEKNVYAWVQLAKSYKELKQPNQAIESLNKAIGIDASYGYAWCGLGDTYSDLHQHDQAIESYKKAIDCKDCKSYALLRIGLFYQGIKQYDQAIEYFNKAITVDKDYVFAWARLAGVYRELKQYDQAIEYLKKAIAIDENVEYPLCDLSSIYYDKGQYHDAISYAEKLISIKNHDAFWGSMAQELIIKATERIDSQKQLIENQSAEANILRATKGIEEIVERNKQSYLDFIQEVPVSKVNEDGICFLEILRKWNSFTPIVAPHSHFSLGGGYFLKIHGKGIVIDPGFNFIQNFQSREHFFHEIDAILISHAHNDHTADLESILNMLYKYNLEIKDSEDIMKSHTIRRQIAEKKKIAVGDVPANIIEEEFRKSNRGKTIDIYITSSVFKKFSGLLEISSKCGYRIHIVEKDQVYDLDYVKFKVIDAKHHDTISDNSSVGFCLEFPDRIIVYTGDTGWNDRVEAQYSQIKQDYHSKQIILLAHIGGFKGHEFEYLTTKGEGYDAFYGNHLGRLGLCRAVSILNPNICIISEFGEELVDFRDKLADIYREQYPNTIFIPADIGLKYDIKNNLIYAIIDVIRRKQELCYGYIAPEKVCSYEIPKNCSIYYHSNCIKKEYIAEVI